MFEEMLHRKGTAMEQLTSGQNKNKRKRVGSGEGRAINLSEHL